MAYQAAHSDVDEADKLHESHLSGYADPSTSDPSYEQTLSSYSSFPNPSYAYDSGISYDINGQPMAQSWPSWHSLQTQQLVQPYPNYWSKPLNEYGGNAMLSTDDTMSPQSEESETKPVKHTSKKFKCDFDGCNSAFARKADRDRHKFCVHNKGTSEKKDCPEESCTRKGEHGFTRTDHLTEHLRNFHHREIERRRRGRPRSTYRNEIKDTGL